MRKVASIRLTCNSAAVFDHCLDRLNRWVRAKGTVDRSSDPAMLTLVDGRVAQYDEEALGFGSQQLRAFRITEPTVTGPFRTSIELSHSDRITEIACQLYTGRPLSIIAPLCFEARCPNILQGIVEASAEWLVGETVIALSAVEYRGRDGGRDLCELIWSQSRHLPLVVVSEHQGLILHPNLPDELARDLCGVAVVATIDDEASWCVTKAHQREWSCYNGAIRIYWPMLSDLAALPRRHPLWTAERLMSGVPNVAAAASRIREQVRRRIYDLSTFAHADRSLGDSIRIEERARSMAEMRRVAADSGEWRELADEVDRENEELRKECGELRERVADLSTRLANLLPALQWGGAEQHAGQEVVPADATPPSTVSEAVDQAREKHGDCLLFGSDVEEGIKRLHTTAGPPDKILLYLDGLAEMTKRRASGALGTNPLIWLNDHGIAASNEGEDCPQE